MQSLLAKVKPDSCDGLRDRALFEVLYSSGIRIAELLGLDVQDIDLSTATAVVTGKGAKQRVVPLGKSACRHLELYLHGARDRLPPGSREQALWLTQSGRRLTYASCRRRIAAYAATLRLPFPVTPHTFRRSCTTELVRRGANLWHVKELLGHENLDTLQHYVRLTIADLMSAVGQSVPGRSIQNVPPLRADCAQCGDAAALRRERPHREPSTIDPSPLCPRMVASTHRAGTRHPPQDGCQPHRRTKTAHFDRRVRGG